MEQHNANWKIDKQEQILNKHMRRKIKKEFLILRTVVKETENYFFSKNAPTSFTCRNIKLQGFNDEGDICRHFGKTVYFIH